MIRRTRTYLVLVASAGVILGQALASGGVSATTGNANVPAWYGHGHRVSASGDLLVRILGSGATSNTAPSNQGRVCVAEPSPSGNVQVNCRAEDGTSAQNTESETTVAAFGQKVVVGFNDSLVCCKKAINLTGYSVSTDSGGSFTDLGDLPWQPNVQPIGDPTVAVDGSGNFYFASLALGSIGLDAHSLISFYKMPVGSSTFQLVSVPVNVGSSHNFFADKEYLAVAPDGAGNLHFYITWTLFSKVPQSPIMMTDSTDGINWRTTMISTADACAQGSNPVPAGGKLYVSWFQSVPAGCTNFNITAANLMMASVDVASATVTARTVIAPINGSGDKIVACNNALDLREVIETEPGHDARNFEMPTTTIDGRGNLYAAWNDRPAGVGGGNLNATRIFLSVSRDGNMSWSSPQLISGATSHKTMADRFQPWITIDASGLHAMWYQRVAGNPVDLIRTDKEDLTLATATALPVVTSAEAQISSVDFPIIQTNPNQDPIISNCYMGDYNNIGSNGTTRFVTWGDNRNPALTSPPEANQPDTFLASY